MSGVLIHNIGELITLAPLAKSRRLTKVSLNDLGRLKNAWLAMENGKVLATGEGPVPHSYQQFTPHDAQQSLIMPGLVDAHTHPIFGGSRAAEFCERLAGATYQEIAAKGGGIASTVRATRAASDEQLRSTLRTRLHASLALGVTTMEVKSGYGLSVPEELRLLRLLNEAKALTPQTLEVTCLALHAIPPEFQGKNAAFIQTMTTELLPQVAKERLATWVDAFVEKGYFMPADCDAYFAQAKKLGLKIRIHADEFADSGAAMAGVKWGARSADHMECTPREALEAMAAAQMIAIILPGTSLYTKIPYANGALMREVGCPVALASDFNPGSCQLNNMALVATLGALYCGLDLPHAIAAVTYVAAASLDLAHCKGALAPQFDADVVMYPMATVEDWLASMGRTMPTAVYAKGSRVI